MKRLMKRLQFSLKGIRRDGRTAIRDSAVYLLARGLLPAWLARPALGGLGGQLDHGVSVPMGVRFINTNVQIAKGAYIERGATFEGIARVIIDNGARVSASETITTVVWRHDGLEYHRPLTVSGGTNQGGMA